MNWKNNLPWFFLWAISTAVAGCSDGSVANQGNSVANNETEAISPSANTNVQQTTATPDATQTTLVTLDLPGMT